MSHHKFQAYFFIGILVASLLLTLLLFRSYLVALAFGGVLAVATRPVFKWINGYIKNDGSSAFLTLIIAATVLLAPLAWFLAALTDEIVSLIGNSQRFFDAGFLNGLMLQVLPRELHPQLPVFTAELVKLAEVLVTKLSASLVGFFSNAVASLMGLFVMLFSTYYLLKDGARFKKELLFLSPLSDENDEMVFQRLIHSVSAVINGLLTIALVKGVVASFAFYMFGVPAPIFWGAMCGMASFIPFVGSSLVTVPAIIYLFMTGHVGMAIGLAVVSIGIIGTIDNILQPKLVQRKTDIHPLLILLSIVGGLEFYGFSGFILGPLTVAVTMALVDIYRRDFKSDVEHETIIDKIKDSVSGD